MARGLTPCPTEQTEYILATGFKLQLLNGLAGLGPYIDVCNALKLSHFTAVKLSHPGLVLSSGFF
jgi:hypothetical protein